MRRACTVWQSHVDCQRKVIAATTSKWMNSDWWERGRGGGGQIAQPCFQSLIPQFNGDLWISGMTLKVRWTNIWTEQQTHKSSLFYRVACGRKLAEEQRQAEWGRVINAGILQRRRQRSFYKKEQAIPSLLHFIFFTCISRLMLIDFLFVLPKASVLVFFSFISCFFFFLSARFCLSSSNQPVCRIHLDYRAQILDLVLLVCQSLFI